MSKYITSQGDMWDKIARDQLGGEEYTDALIYANTNYCNVYIFSAGVELTLPDIENISTISTLPPWKQVNR